MGKLPRSIIKKYGISKKAWQVYRSQKSKPKKRRTSTRKVSSPRRVRKVARRKRSSRRKSTVSLSPNKALMYGFGYGLVRETLNQGVKKLTGSFALNLGDEVVLGAVHYFGAKQNWFGARELFLAGLTVEAARLGSSMIQGGLNFFGSGTSNGDPQ